MNNITNYSAMNSLFLGNIRGWQLIIIMFTILVMLVIPFLLGIRVGRCRRKDKCRRRP